MVDPAILAEIKQKDPHPYFQAYSVIHEGISTPTVEGEGPVQIHWGKRAVQSLKNIIKKGVKLFKGHNSTNDNQDKQVLGEVVGSQEKMIDGKLHHVIVAYHPPEVKEIAKQCDICSQEAEWNFIESAGKIIADSIHKLTGIALGSSSTEQPAFSGARRLGFIQAFEVENPNELPGDGGKNLNGELSNKEKIMTIHDVRKAIIDLNIWPKQLFDEEKLRQDMVAAKIIGDYESLKQENIRLVEENNNLKTDSDAKIKDLQIQIDKSSAKGRIDNMISNMQLTDKQKSFITNRLDKGSSTIEDFTDEGLQKYLDNEVSLFKEFATYYNTETASDVSLTSGDGKGGETDYSKADNNELLEEDFIQED
jgi:hypothetical protein